MRVAIAVLILILCVYVFSEGRKPSRSLSDGLSLARIAHVLSDTSDLAGCKKRCDLKGESDRCYANCEKVDKSFLGSVFKLLEGVDSLRNKRALSDQYESRSVYTRTCEDVCGKLTGSKREECEYHCIW
jgi:hypothetical protein